MLSKFAAKPARRYGSVFLTALGPTCTYLPERYRRPTSSSGLTTRLFEPSNVSVCGPILSNGAPRNAGTEARRRTRYDAPRETGRVALRSYASQVVARAAEMRSGICASAIPTAIRREGRVRRRPITRWAVTGSTRNWSIGKTLRGPSDERHSDRGGNWPPASCQTRNSRPMTRLSPPSDSLRRSSSRRAETRQPL